MQHRPILSNKTGLVELLFVNLYVRGHTVSWSHKKYTAVKLDPPGGFGWQKGKTEILLIRIVQVNFNSCNYFPSKKKQPSMNSIWR